MRLQRLLIILVMVLLTALTINAQGAPAPINDALADLNQRLGTNYTLNDFNWFWEQQNYEDTSLGCPIEGEVYTQQQVVAYRFVFTVEGNIYDYRVTADRNTVRLCSVTPEGEVTEDQAEDLSLSPDYDNPLCPAPPEDISYMPTRLTVESQARVLPGLPNNVRAEPSLQGEAIGEIPGEGIFSVLQGPICGEEGYLWWQVDYDGFVGWTAEGRNYEYLLEPLPPAQLPTLTPINADNIAQIAEVARIQGNLGRAVAFAESTEVETPGRLVTVGGLGGEGAWVYDLTDISASPYTPAGTDVLTAIDFGIDPRVALFGSRDGGLRLWDIRPNAGLVERAFLQAHDSPLNAVAYNSTSTLLAGSGGRAFLREDQGDNLYAISIWNTENVALVGGLRGHTDEVTGLAFAPDTNILYSGSLDTTLRVWDTASLQNILMVDLSEPITSLALSADGTMLALGTGNGSIVLWDTATNTEIQTLSGHLDSVNSLAFSANGSILVSGGTDNNVIVWAVNGDSQIAPTVLIGHDEPVTGVAINFAGELIASISEDDTLRLWGIGSENFG